ncbi:MFS transporter [Phormidesmis priestleyi]|uniref:MFS transporter n=1 Tax=Phormidesmis priestleyi TaxID=268141 RepID=UPI001E564F23|nr:MFS transporter [Phormidesmis priestleyi]
MMFQTLKTLLELGSHPIPIAQVSVEPGVIALEEELMFSGPQFLVALIAGLMMAFAFQFLLTNLSVAFAASPGALPDSDESESIGKTIRGIETKLGLFVLITVSIALFIASFLAVKLSLVGSTTLGAILGVVIWATYFSVLVWLGSGAVGSLVGSFISTATSGMQSMMGVATTALGANVAKNQVVSTAEEITAAVRRELTSGFDPDSIQKTLQSSLSNLQLPKLNLDEIKGQFETLLKDSNLKDVADSDFLKNIDRDSLVKLVSSRTDFSKQEVDRVADQLESALKSVVGSSGKPQDVTEQLASLLKSAKPEDLTSKAMTDQLNQLVKTVSGTMTPGSNLTNRALQLGLGGLLSQVMKNTNLSDLDVEKVSGQLQQLRTTLQGQADKVGKQISEKSAKPFSVIQSDLESYLLSSPPWHLNRETIKQEFKDVIFDPQADPGAIRKELESIDRSYFVETLSRRDGFTPERIQDIASQLEDIRAEVFNSVQTAESETRSQDLRSRVENYLKSTGKEELNPESIEREFTLLLEDPEAGLDALGSRLGQFDRDTLVKLLGQREDVNPEEANQIVGQLESTRDRVLAQAKDVQDRVQSEAQELRRKVEEYLRNTQKEELNPEGIERDLRTLFDDPQAGLSALRSRLSQFDRDTLVQLLSQRQDLSEEQVNQVLDQVESIRDSILQAPQKVVGKAKEQYEQTTTAIADYLRKTDLQELDPEGIQRDLQTLLSDPKAGTYALRDRLSQVDRDTLVKLLTQRGNLTEEQVNQAIEQVQTAIRGTIKAPRRLAKRAQKQAIDFETSLESYLRNTHKEELNPDGIKRDLQLLLQHPQSGLGNLGDRLSQVDRSTLVALLSQRKDITEEEANRIADQVESTFKSSVEQIQKVQQTVQSAIEGVFGKMRDYLDSLERPELSYEGIQQDFSTLFDDPQAGFEALRHRLGGFDRDTLIAVLSSREDISEADANRIVAQVEGARDRVLNQAERIQQGTQRRIKEVRQQAQKQAIEAQKMAADAAWWLFGAALTSLAASAIAGFLAVGTRF